jgi:hypothetical protein
MIDTIRLSHILPFHPESEMDESVFTRTRGSFGRRSYIYNSDDGVHFTWSELPFSDKARLSVEASLPKFLFGNNIDELDAETTETALQRLGEYVGDVTGVDFETSSAVVTRADFCRNFRLGDETKVRDWNNAVRDRFIPRFDTKPYNWTGVYFSSSAKTNPRQICCYSKLDDIRREIPIKPSLNTGELHKRQALHSKAKGVYRIEDRFKDSRRVAAIAKRFSVPQTAKALLTPVISDSVITDVGVSLGLNKPLVCNSREDFLCDSLGFDKARSLIGYLHQRETYGVDLLKRELKPASFFRYEKMLKQTGVLSINAYAELPPLMIASNSQNTQ